MNVYKNTIEKMNQVDPVNADLYTLEALNYYAKHIVSGIIEAPSERESEAWLELSNQVINQSEQYDDYINNATDGLTNVIKYAEINESQNTIDENEEEEEAIDWDAIEQESEERLKNYDDEEETAKS